MAEYWNSRVEISDDTDFFTNILAQICDYAVKNNMEPDDTIKTVAQNMMSLLEISTFNGWCEKND